jgi:hypothetical protein
MFKPFFLMALMAATAGLAAEAACQKEATHATKCELCSGMKSSVREPQSLPIFALKVTHDVSTGVFAVPRSAASQIIT